jgi:D-tagatose-1,6-bisphosphate aldolase subunit GatZ/KbaZ
MKLSELIKKKALPSFCTSNLDVLKSILIYTKKKRLPCLIESTSNQVNQYGGYTNLKPKQFHKKIFNLAKSINFSKKKLYLGGDHLGPLPWKNEKSKKSLRNSVILINDYIKANYCKIHLDTSIKCADDKNIDHVKIFDRTKYLLKKINLKNKINKIFLVIGSEVPLSGSNEKGRIKISKINDIRSEIDKFKKLLNKLYKKQMSFALVIEPGMHYLNYTISKPKLKNFLPKKKLSIENNFFYEAHSTDYQSKKTLSKLVKNNFKFLKVGPELTYYYARALFFMIEIEARLNKSTLSNLRTNLIRVMMNDKKYWKNYYSKNYKKLILNSQLDRMRYYLNYLLVKRSIKKLSKNINTCEYKVICKYLNNKKMKKEFSKLKNLKISNFYKIIYVFMLETLNKYYSASGFKIN